MHSTPFQTRVAQVGRLDGVLAVAVFKNSSNIYNGDEQFRALVEQAVRLHALSFAEFTHTHFGDRVIRVASTETATVVLVTPKNHVIVKSAKRSMMQLLRRAGRPTPSMRAPVCSGVHDEFPPAR